jgi:hypothetical protein
MKRIFTVLFFILCFSVFSEERSFLLSPYQSLNVNNFEQVREELRSPFQLYNYIREEFTYSHDTKFSNFYDYWMTPKDMFVRKTGDCDDYATFSQNILSYHGFTNVWIGGRWAGGGHAITVFKWNGKWHGIGNTHDVYEEGETIDGDINSISSNFGFSSVWVIFTNVVPSSRMVFSALENNKSKWMSMDRVSAQQYVSSVRFFGKQKSSFEYSFSPYLFNKNKMSLAYMHRFNNDWLKLGISYSAHGYYLNMFNPLEFKEMNHVMWVHSVIKNRIGVSAYYDVSQGMYKGFDFDFKFFDWVGKLNGQAAKAEGYISFRNGFQVIDTDLRVWWSKQFYTYLIKRDKHISAQFYYDVFDRLKMKTKYLMTNTTIEGTNVTKKVEYGYKAPEVSKFVNFGLYADTDYNFGIFLTQQKMTMQLYVYDIDFELDDKKALDLINSWTSWKLRLNLAYRF